VLPFYAHGSLGLDHCGGTHPECFLYCSVLSIEVEDISGKGGIYIQSDGEHLGFLPKKISVQPAAIEMILWFHCRTNLWNRDDEVHSL